LHLVYTEEKDSDTYELSALDILEVYSEN